MVVMQEGVNLIGSTGEIAARLAAAMVGGMILGINRDLRGKPAGVRTHALVAIGACLVTVVAMEVAQVSGTVDANAASRVIQGVITGIGFLGGGVILKMPERRTIQGLTTAASVWITACIGVAFGAGMWRTSIIGLGLTLFALLAGAAIERWGERVFAGHDRPAGFD
jgi:putative Mg2+ transporter-C (MgtC) family protein